MVSESQSVCTGARCAVLLAQTQLSQHAAWHRRGRTRTLGGLSCSSAFGAFGFFSGTNFGAGLAAAFFAFAAFALGGGTVYAGSSSSTSTAGRGGEARRVVARCGVCAPGQGWGEEAGKREVGSAVSTWCAAHLGAAAAAAAAAPSRSRIRHHRPGRGPCFDRSRGPPATRAHSATSPWSAA